MIIVEAATNWNDLSMAKEIITKAKEAGDVLVKFQLFNADDDKGKPHYDWVKEHELTFEQAKQLFDYGASIGQEVFFSVFGVEYVDWCEKIGVMRYKLACDCKDNKLIEAIRDTNKLLIRSLSNPSPFVSSSKYRVLYCVPEYPANKVNLKGLGWYDGYSDHTIGMEAVKIATVLFTGIKDSYLEKHFCLEHDSRYPDNEWSMDHQDLKELIRWEKVCKEVL